MNRADAERLISWMMDTSEKVDYGTITLSIIRHAGKTRYIEKTVQEKEQVSSSGAANA